MDTEITKIKLKIGEVEVELSVEDARDLKRALCDLFGEKQLAPIVPSPYPVPYPVPVWPRPWREPNYWGAWRGNWETWSGSGSASTTADTRGTIVLTQGFTP